MSRTFLCHRVRAGNHGAPSAPEPPTSAAEGAIARADAMPAKASAPAREIGGPEGPDPTRFGDWERQGRCIDF